MSRKGRSSLGRAGVGRVCEDARPDRRRRADDPRARPARRQGVDPCLRPRSSSTSMTRPKGDVRRQEAAQRDRLLQPPGQSGDGCDQRPDRSGPLYDVDTRLRPQGGEGMLAVSLDGFLKYQRNEAWTWEHMALCRARPIYGSPGKRDQCAARSARSSKTPVEIRQRPAPTPRRCVRTCPAISRRRDRSTSSLGRAAWSTSNLRCTRFS